MSILNKVLSFICLWMMNRSDEFRIRNIKSNRRSNKKSRGKINYKWATEEKFCREFPFSYSYLFNDRVNMWERLDDIHFHDEWATQHGVLHIFVYESVFFFSERVFFSRMHVRKNSVGRESNASTLHSSASLEPTSTSSDRVEMLIFLNLTV